MYYLRITTAAIAISMLALTGCGKQASKSEAKKDSTPVLATVNGANITQKQFDNELKNLPPQLQPMAQSPEGRKELLESMIIREIVYQDAQKQGLNVSLISPAEMMATLQKAYAFDEAIIDKVRLTMQGSEKSK